MTFFIYGRKSVYTGKGESIENQIEMCRQYIASRFAAEAERRVFVYEDEGFSAKIRNARSFRKCCATFAGCGRNISFATALTVSAAA